MHVREKQQLLARTWDQLQTILVDLSDSRSVLRYEKLAKLWMALSKQLAKDAEADDEDELDL